MKKLVIICLVCVLTAIAWGNVTTVDFNENGNGWWDNGQNGGTLVSGTGVCPVGNANWSTLYYVLPSPVVEGDLVLYESEFDVSDVLRFTNVNNVGRVYVYSDTDEGVDSLADTGLPSGFLPNSAGTAEVEIDNGWSAFGVVWVPSSGMPGYMSDDVAYVFISDVPEPATICLLGIGALSLIRRKK
jgi:hypothetical protein